jgi:hypothetical protein
MLMARSRVEVTPVFGIFLPRYEDVGHVPPPPVLEPIRVEGTGQQQQQQHQEREQSPPSLQWSPPIPEGQPPGYVA